MSEDEGQYVSKTQLKQESTERQKLGEEIVQLSPAHLELMPLDDDLKQAIDIARKINRKKDGYRRQLQYIGKVLRSRDIEPLYEALAKVKDRHAQTNAHFHYLEKLRDTIIENGDEGIQQALETHPNLSRQTLRQHCRQIQKEREKNAPPKHFRALFQYLKTELEDQQ
jgi:ribosome-associated protein